MEQKMTEPESIFVKYIKNRKILVSNKAVFQNSFIPNTLPHRKNQIDKIVSIVAVGLDGEKPTNLMIYGKTGTGKTAVMNYIGKELKKVDKSEERCVYLYVNCVIVETAYGILYNIASQFVKDINQKIPYTGWSFEKLFNELCYYLEEENKVFVIVLDEIDNMILKKGDLVFYYLAGINEHLKKSKVSLIGISNNLKILQMVEPKARSRFGGESINFPSYNNQELQDILTDRIKDIVDEDVIEPQVIPLIAAIAAKQDGDARLALGILKTAIDAAERNGDTTVAEAHVRLAQETIEFDITDEAIKNLTPHSKVVLYAIIKCTEKNLKTITTGDIYVVYREICNIVTLSPNTQRRVTDLISELDMLGLVTANIKSFGRAGRTKEIELAIPKESINTFKNDPLFKPLQDYRDPHQTTLRDMETP